MRSVYLLVVVFFLSTFFVQAQISKIEGNYSLGLSYSHQEVNNKAVEGDPQQQAFAESSIGVHEQLFIADKSYSVNFLMYFHEREKCRFVTGLHFQSYREKLDKSKFTFGDQIDARHGFVYSPTPVSRTKNQQFLSIPFGVELNLFTNDKGYAFIRPMVSLDYYLFTTHVNKYEEIKTYRKNVTDDSFASLTSSVQLNVGYKRKITSKILLSISAQGNTNLISNKKRDYPIKERLYFYGMNIGLGLMI